MNYSAAITVLLGSMLLGASAFPGIRAALQGYSPFHLALLRFLIASLTLGVLAIPMRLRRPRAADLPRLILLGFLGFAVYHVALNYGELTVTGGAASFIVCTVPIFNVVLSMLILKERMKPAAWAGMAISMFGVGMITLGESGGLKPSFGALLILVAAVAQSFYFVLQKRLLERYRAFDVVTWSAWFGTAFMLVLTPGLVDAVRHAPVGSTLAVIYLGIAPGAIAYCGWSYALARLGVARMSSYLYLIPVIAMVIGYFWLREIPTVLSLIGGVIALGGVILADRFDRFWSGAGRARGAATAAAAAATTTTKTATSAACAAAPPVIAEGGACAATVDGN